MLSCKSLDETPSTSLGNSRTLEKSSLVAQPPQLTYMSKLLRSLCSCFRPSEVMPIEENSRLLPDKSIVHMHKKTLLLDLDETLIHSTFAHETSADFNFSVKFGRQAVPVSVVKRPGVEEFLEECGALFEVFIFTASVPEYANPIIDLLDNKKRVQHRLFRQDCTETNSGYIKNLSRVNRDLKDLIIVDVRFTQNSPYAYSFNPENAVPIKSWFSDPEDLSLIHI